MEIISQISQLRKNTCDYLEGILGAPSEQLCLIITILLTIPFSFINYLIHGKYTRLYYSLILGLIFQYSIYGFNFLHVIISSIFVYLFILFLGRKVTPWIVLIVTLIHLSALNIYRVIYMYGEWAIDDTTTIYMMSLCKFSSFAFSYDDGKKEDKDFKSEHHKSYKIKEMPSILEFFSYIFFYPTAIIGPFIEYKDFKNFINEEDCYKNLTKKLGTIIYHGLLKFILSLIIMGLFALLSPKFPQSLFGEPDFIIQYPKYWQRLVFLYFSAPVLRLKYYSAWTLSHSGLIFSGFAYGESPSQDGKSIVQDFEKGNYGNLILNEFGMNPRLKMVYWNMSVHTWLKYNVYTRVLSGPGVLKNNRNIASLITYVISAIWHGFYTTYYICFTLIFLFEQGSALLEILGFYKFVDKRIYLWPFVSVINMLAFDAILIIFYLLDFKKFVVFLKNLNGYPVNFILVLFTISMIARLGGFIKKTDKEEKDQVKKKES